MEGIYLLSRFYIWLQKIIDIADKDGYNQSKESKECVEGRFLYGTCKGDIKRTDYNTNRN